MNSKKIKKLLELKRYNELTEEELRFIEKYISEGDGSPDSLLASLEYDKMIEKMKNSNPVLNHPHELTAVIMDSIHGKNVSQDSVSLIDKIFEMIVTPQVQYAARSLLVLIVCFYFFEEITSSSEISDFENKYYSETVASAGVESIIKNEVGFINKLQDIYKLIIEEKDYIELGEEWVVMQRSEQKRIIAYYINYVLGDKYDKSELDRLIDQLNDINFLDGLNKEESDKLDKHRKLVQKEIYKTFPGGKSHE